MRDFPQFRTNEEDRHVAYANNFNGVDFKTIELSAKTKLGVRLQEC